MLKQVYGLINCINLLYYFKERCILLSRENAFSIHSNFRNNTGMGADTSVSAIDYQLNKI
jgi:hypothetical protein